MKLPLHLGIHCHQPVENFYHVVDEAVEKSYLPFFETAAKKDSLKVSVHYSGWLFEYIKNNHPNLFGLMQEINSNGQLEFFSGGYYEPVLASIPSIDRREQIKMLNGFIEDNFKVTPEGLWLTERVWDSSIIPDCAECGIKYVIVDDYHFIAAGFYESMLHTHFKTEQDGQEMLIFPISEKLRYMIPFKPAKDVGTYLSEIKEAGGKSLVIFDDGEKFGLWPKTHEWVYEKGWLEDFIDTVAESEDAEFALFKDTVKTQKPAQTAYLPTVSYFEMGEWSLFPERTQKMEKLVKQMEKEYSDDTTKVFVKGGIWKNFLVKYPEANRIHKRTVTLSKKANTLKDKELLTSLYKAQCNDVLWHGVFGGLYLPNLRNNAYRFIIEGEKRLEKLENTIYPSVESGDFDFDGYDEIYARTKDTNYMFVSRDGGQLVSLEDKENLYNFQNTLTRRKEAYHEKLFESPKTEDTENIDDEGISTIHNDSAVVDESVRKYLVYDWHNKNSFVDHFTPDFGIEKFIDMTYQELGDFANQPANFTVDKSEIVFTREGGIYLDGVKNKTSVRKQFKLLKEGLGFEIEIETDFYADIDYVMEINLHFNDMANVEIDNEPIEEMLRSKGEKFVIEDRHTPKKAILSTNKEVNLYAFPVMTLSQSESGADLTIQGITILIPFKFREKQKITGTLVLS
jgi:hypothetical protein